MKITATPIIPGIIDLSSQERLGEGSPLEREQFRVTIGPNQSIIVDDKWYNLITIQNSLGRGWIEISDYDAQDVNSEEISTPESYTNTYSLTKVEIINRADYPQDAFEKYNKNMDDIDALLSNSNSIGTSTFIDLTDTPSNYTGEKGKVVIVKTDESGLAFSNANVSGSSTFIDLTDTPSNYTGKGGKIVSIKLNESGLEFSNASTDAVWGNITGVISNQTDLQVELDQKANINNVESVKRYAFMISGG